MVFNSMKLNFRKLFLLSNIILFTITIHAQIKGTITDQSSHQPIIGASVFVNNTTYGCQSDINGHFELQYFPAPPFQIIVSSVGYEPTSINLNDKQTTDLKIVLKPKTTDLNEVVVLPPEKDGWAKYGKEFLRDFIGYSDFANECEILNKEVLEFRDDRSNHKLLVSAEKPLKIRNKATGYLITYWLDNYEKDYLTRKLFHKGYIQFETLQSKKKKINQQWETNRESAYLGSLNHFMRSVYNNTVYEDSFELRVYKEIPTEEYGKTVPWRTFKLTQRNDSLIEIALQFLNYPKEYLTQIETSIAKWIKTDNDLSYQFTLNEQLKDSVQVVSKCVKFCFNVENKEEKRIELYDYNYVPEDTIYANMLKKAKAMGIDTKAMPPKKQVTSIAYLWKQKMPLDSFVKRDPNNGVILKFKDYIHITYLKEREEKAYFENQVPVTHHIPEMQQSLITLENADGIHVLSDGNYYDPYDLIIREYWNYEKMDKMLPLDYKFPSQ